MASATKAAKDWHPEDIKAEVRKRKGTLATIARSKGLSDAACRVAFLKPVPAANKAIAEFIGEPVNVLWPQWFDAEGNRKSSTSSAKDSGERSRGHRQKKVAK